MRIPWNRKWDAPLAAGVSFVAGAAAGYFVARKRMAEEVNNIIENMVRIDSQGGVILTSTVTDEWVEEKETVVTVSEGDGLAAAFARAIANPEAELTVDDNPYHRAVDKTDNVLEREDNWDISAELSNRGPNAPYVIHISEFDNREMGFTQEILHWYEGDKTLANDDGLEIPNPNQVVGQLLWGHGSLQPGVVYIRNEDLRAEYEIHREEGSYAQAVLGLEAEEQAEQDDLRHSAMIPRFRLDRD